MEASTDQLEDHKPIRHYVTVVPFGANPHADMRVRTDRARMTVDFMDVNGSRICQLGMQYPASSYPGNPGLHAPPMYYVCSIIVIRCKKNRLF